MYALRAAALRSRERALQTVTPIIAVLRPRHRDIVPITNPVESAAAIMTLIRIFGGSWPSKN